MKQPAGAPRSPPIRVLLLTGFLGAGKTTLLNRLLAAPAFADAMVLVNEYGEIGLDQHLFGTSAVIPVTSGCVCCTVRGELAFALEGLVRDIDNGRRGPVGLLVLETTGLALPGPILTTLIAHPYLRLRYRLAGVVTAIAADTLRDTLATYGEAAEQVASADLVVVTKTDVGPFDAASRRAVREINPMAPTFDGVSGAGEVADAVARLVTDPAAAAAGRLASASGAFDGSHVSAFQTFTLLAPQPVDKATLEAFLDQLAIRFGARVLRLKGLMALRGTPEGPVVVQAVQGAFALGPPLSSWPGGQRGGALTLIGRDLPESDIRRQFEAVANALQPDTPDAEAVFSNPLVVPGLRRAPNA